MCREKWVKIYKRRFIQRHFVNTGVFKLSRGAKLRPEIIIEFFQGILAILRLSEQTFVADFFDVRGFELNLNGKAIFQFVEAGRI